MIYGDDSPTVLRGGKTMSEIGVITVESYSCVTGKDEQECKEKVKKLMDAGRIHEVIEEPHPSRPSNKKSNWVAYVY